MPVSNTRGHRVRRCQVSMAPRTAPSCALWTEVPGSTSWPPLCCSKISVAIMPSQCERRKTGLSFCTRGGIVGNSWWISTLWVVLELHPPVGRAVLVTAGLCSPKRYLATVSTPAVQRGRTSVVHLTEGPLEWAWKPDWCNALVLAQIILVSAHARVVPWPWKGTLVRTATKMWVKRK